MHQLFEAPEQINEMPQIATEIKARNTHRNVYTQCGEPEKVIAAVIVEYGSIKEISARPRQISNVKRKSANKAGMRVSAVYTYKVKRTNMHRKVIGTDEWMSIEEDEVVI